MNDRADQVCKCGAALTRQHAFYECTLRPLYCFGVPTPHPVIELVSRNGRWTCPTCGSSYGPSENCAAAGAVIDHDTREQVASLATAARAAGTEEAPVVLAVCEVVLDGAPSAAALEALTKQQRDTLNRWVGKGEGWNPDVALEMCAAWLGIPRPKKSCVGVS